MRFGLLSQHFFPEMVSTGKLVTELATGLAEGGYKVDVVTGKPTGRFGMEHDEPEGWPPEGLTVRCVPSFGSRARSVVGRGIHMMSYVVSSFATAFVGGRKWDGLLIFTNPPILGVIGWLLRKMVGIPYIMVIHDVYPDIAIHLGAVRQGSWIAAAWEKLDTAILESAEAVVVLGRDMEAQVLSRFVGSEASPTVRVIPNWFTGPAAARRSSGDDWRRQHSLEGRFVVMYSGNMGRTHDLHLLIEAADLLRDESKIAFVLIGDGAGRNHLEALVQQRQLKNVTLLPFQPAESVPSVLAAADLSVVSLAERFTGLSVPSKAYGIMSSGTPLLAMVGRSSEIGMVVVASECGSVVGKPTGAGIAEIIIDYLHDPERVQKEGENARRLFQNHYTLDHALERYSDLCRTTFGPPSPRAMSEAGGNSRRSRQEAGDMGRHQDSGSERRDER